MSRIKELLKDPDSVLIFDIDGVLAICEWGEYNHFDMSDEEWNARYADGQMYYTEEFVSKKMQDFLKSRDMSRVFVVTVAESDAEGKDKIHFSNEYYNIPRENVYYVKNKASKLDKVLEIRKKFPNLDDRKILMIDDTIEVLNNIMENTNYTTVHISSFLDI